MDFKGLKEHNAWFRGIPREHGQRAPKTNFGEVARLYSKSHYNPMRTFRPGKGTPLAEAPGQHARAMDFAGCTERNPWFRGSRPRFIMDRHPYDFYQSA